MQIAALFHGLPGVYIHIQQRLFHLTFVGFHRPEFFIKFSVNNNLFFCAPEDLRTFLHQPVQVHCLYDPMASLGKSQQLTCKLGTAPDILFDRFQFLIMSLSQTLFQPHQGYISLDCHKEIVEVMGDPSCKRSKRLHFFCLSQLFCHP